MKTQGTSLNTKNSNMDFFEKKSSGIDCNFKMEKQRPLLPNKRLTIASRSINMLLEILFDF